MKNFAVLIIATLLSIAGARGQVVSVELQLESEQYLANESLIVKVRINNSTGQTLHLGEEPDWLSFVIESSEGPYVRTLQAPDVRVPGGFDLESSHTATKRVNLAPAFDLTRLGRYKVSATVNVPRFGANYASPSKAFFISNGKPLGREIEFGVPTSQADDPNSPPEIRRYTLLQSLSGQESRLYVRLSDTRGQNLRVIPLGTLISFSKPEPQLDKWSNLHVLFETGAQSFSYSVINPDGFLIARETHQYSDTRPALAVSDEGRISVHGGSRRVTADDIPPFDTAELPKVATPEPTLPPPTNSAKAKKASSKTTDKKAATSANAKEKKKP